MKPDNLNLQGFEGDSILAEEVKRMCDLHKIDVIFETGTYFGNTTVKLHEMVPDVVTIESSAQYVTEARKQFTDKNIISVFGASQEKLARYIQEKLDEGKKNFLFFLDAHWEHHCPLLDELRIIAEAGLKPVIIIHDFKVPARPELGFDRYNGQDFEFEWIRPSLEKIYGPKFAYHYNEEAVGHKRGVIFTYTRFDLIA